MVLQPERVIAGGSVAAGVRVRNIATHGLLPTMLELPVGSVVHRYAVPRLGPAESHEETFTIRTERRGVIPVGPATTRRGDPLAILSRDVAWTDVTEILVRPPMVPMDSLGAGLLRDLEGVSTDAVSQSDLAFHTLREYVAGDDLRHVHWRSSAKAMALPTTPGCWCASTSTPCAATSPWSSTTRRRCGPTPTTSRPRCRWRVDHRARDARRVRDLVRLRDQRLLRGHRPPGARLGMPCRARQHRAGGLRPPGAVVCPTPACSSSSAGRPATSRTSSGR